MPALIKSMDELTEILTANGKVENSALAPGDTEARNWLKELKSDGYVKFDKKQNAFMLLKSLS